MIHSLKLSCLFVCLAAVLKAGIAFGVDLQSVIKHPQQYEGHRVQLDGIARVPGYFYLFADPLTAAKTDLSKALLVRKNNFAGHEYRELDRQWVRVTGLISSEPRRGWDPGMGLLLDRAEFLQDRPAPRIKDPTVLAIFRNATNQALDMRLRPHSNGVAQEFFLGPYETAEIDIHEGKIAAALLTGPAHVPLDERKVGKTIVRGQIKFRPLPNGYEYSPQWSDERTLYYRVTDDRIELVPASQAKGWAKAAGRRIP